MTTTVDFCFVTNEIPRHCSDVRSGAGKRTDFALETARMLARNGNPLNGRLVLGGFCLNYIWELGWYDAR